MSNGALREELLNRYIQTGKIGLAQPTCYQEAISLINTIVDLYENEEEKEVKEYHFTLTEVANKLKEFLDNY